MPEDDRTADSHKPTDVEPAWWHLRPGESWAEYEARLAADPRWKAP